MCSSVAVTSLAQRSAAQRRGRHTGPGQASPGRQAALASGWRAGKVLDPVANIKSQIKRIGTNEKRRLRNKAAKSEVKTRIKSAIYAAGAGRRTAAEDLRLAVKRLDKAAARGIIHRNQAANRKSALMRQVAELAAVFGRRLDRRPSNAPPRRGQRPLRGGPKRAGLRQPPPAVAASVSAWPALHHSERPAAPRGRCGKSGTTVPPALQAQPRVPSPTGL